MSSHLLEIEPQELKFLFELKKQTSCSIRLVNKTNQHIAFKVKTTTPKKYCVRPNTGIVKPKSTCDFMVTMQAQRMIPPDLICKDKFLLQSTVVPVGTDDEDITSSTFSKDDGRYVEEKKLRVILVSPPPSPILSPIKGTLKEVPAYEASALVDEPLNNVENIWPHHTVIEDVMESKMVSAESELAKDVERKRTKDIKHETMKDVEHNTMKDVETKATKDVEHKTTKEAEFKILKDMEEKFVKEIEETRSKLKELELKLSVADVRISKLTEEKKLNTQDRESLKQDLALLRSNRGIEKVQAGFPLMFVCMVALVSFFLGYL